jgi:hypothetical protein
MFELIGLVRDLVPVGEKLAGDLKGQKWGGVARDLADGLNVLAPFLDRKFPPKPGDIPVMRRETFDTTTFPSSGGDVALMSDDFAAVSFRGPLRRVGEKRFLRHVKDAVAKELKANGFALVANDLAAQGVTVKAPKAFTDGVIAAMWKKAERDGGLTDEAILAYAATPEVGALGDGKILEFLGRIWEWIVAHKEEILAVVKFILTLLALFGL